MGRTPCCDKMGIKKGPWSAEEDEKLVAYIRHHGHGNWRAIPRQAGLLRCGKSCRLRWNNYLKPGLKRGNLSPEEERIIFQLHEIVGNRWSTIASFLPGRTDNEIKNIWNTRLKKRLTDQNTSALTHSSSTESSFQSSCDERLAADYINYVKLILDIPDEQTSVSQPSPPLNFKANIKQYSEDEMNSAWPHQFYMPSANMKCDTNDIVADLCSSQSTETSLQSCSSALEYCYDQNSSSQLFTIVDDLCNTESYGDY